MATMARCIEIDGQRAALALQEAGQRLEATAGEVALDFSAVRRIDAGGLRAMKDLAAAAEGKKVRLHLRGVSIDIYKVLKLVDLSARFSFGTIRESCS